MTLRLLNFITEQEPQHVGAWTEEGIVDLTTAARRRDPALAGRFQSVVEVLSEPELVQWARDLVEAGVVQPLDREQVKLLAPVPVPGKLFALAGNYVAHIQEGHEGSLAASMNREWRGGPRVFLMPSADTVIADREPVIIPNTATFVDYEAEMAVIIGKAGRHIPEEKALEHVGGLTALNDVSERKLSLWDRGEFAEAYKWFDWLNGKWCDTFVPMGPCAVPLDEVPDLNNLALSLEVNGERLQEVNTGEMIFKVPEIVAYISNLCTLRPGDVIAMGTPAGVGMARERKLQAGDVVAVKLELVGTLTNPVQAE